MLPSSDIDFIYITFQNFNIFENTFEIEFFRKISKHLLKTKIEQTNFENIFEKNVNFQSNFEKMSMVAEVTMKNYILMCKQSLVEI